MTPLFGMMFCFYGCIFLGIVVGGAISMGACYLIEWFINRQNVIKSNMDKDAE